MAWLDSLLEVATHPNVAPTLGRWLSGSPPPGPEDPYTALRARLDALEVRLASPPTPSPGPLPVGGATPSLVAVRDQVLATAGTLKEALRFAREDGLAHPEARQRIQDAQAWLDQLPALERFDLAPERLATLPAAEQQAWTTVLPALRKLRQAGLNKLGTVEGLTETAALAGTVGTQLQMATLVVPDAGPGWQAPPSAEPAAPAPTAGQPYSQYAPDMAVDTGCIECGRGHLAAVGASLQQAVRDAQAKGFTDPDVQARLAFAQEELSALFQYDWTPAKIAKNPPTERAVLEQYRPQVEALWHTTQGLRDPEALAAAAAQAQQIRQGYEQALAATGPVGAFAMMTTAPPATGTGTARVQRDRVYDLTPPTEATVAAATAPVNTPTAFDRVVGALETCGVPVRFRALQATPDYILEGQYDPARNVIQLAPAALSKDSYAVQTALHEASHALLHSRACLPAPPTDHQRQEQQAEDVVIATMLRAGLPIETRDGDIVEPGSRAIAWDKLAAQWTPAEYTNLRWASDWLLQALQTGQPPVCETCPVPQGQEVSAAHG